MVVTDDLFAILIFLVGFGAIAYLFYRCEMYEESRREESRRERAKLMQKLGLDDD